jgi:hypothetical protein
MDHERSVDQPKQDPQPHHQALEQLESALVEFEEGISSGEGIARPQEEKQSGGVQPLSILQLCPELGVGKTWV